MTFNQNELSNPSVPTRTLGLDIIRSLVLITGLLCLSGILFPHFIVNRFITSYLPFAQIMAFPRILGILTLLCCALLAFITRGKSFTILGSVQYAVWFLVGISLVLVPFGLPRIATSPSSQALRSISVVTFNSGGTFTPADLNEIIKKGAPDIIVLPETSAYSAQHTIESIGYDAEVFDTPNSGFTAVYSGQVAATTTIVSQRLGHAHLSSAPATTFGTVAIEFEDDTLPLLVGIHTAPPLPGLMEAWRGDLERLVAFGENATRPTILAGDFNATTRHSAMASRHHLIDSQESCRIKQLGTWPASVNEVLRTPIDHVLVTSDLRTEGCQAFSVGRSDHLAYKTDVIITK